MPDPLQSQSALLGSSPLQPRDSAGRLGEAAVPSYSGCYNQVPQMGAARLTVTQAWRLGGQEQRVSMLGPAGASLLGL